MTMYAEFKRLMGHSTIYFIGNTLNRLGVFLLLPVYTNYLTPGEYGTLELIFVATAFAKIFLGMRLGHATLRFFFEYKTEEDKKKLISTSAISIITWSLLLSTLLFVLSDYLSILFFKGTSYKYLLILGFSILFFETTAEIPNALLRAKEYSILYVVITLSQLFLRVGLNIYIIIALHEGVLGILIGNLITAILAWLCLYGILFWYSGIRFDFSKVKELWIYCYPLFIAAIPNLFINNVDRIFIAKYASLEAVGLYALAIRFGMALQGFILEPFQLNYGPFRFSIMKQTNAREIYARSLTYFLYIGAFMGLFIAIFSQETIELMASKPFKETYRIVPLIISAILISGAGYIFQTGLLIERRTDYVPYITIITAILNIILLLIFVPPFGIYGAAISFLIINLIDAALTFRFSQKIYHINFEYSRIVKIIGIAFSLYFICVLTDGLGLYERIIMKTFIIITFPFFLYTLRFYGRDEMDRLLTFKDKIGLWVLSAVGLNRR